MPGNVEVKARVADMEEKIKLAEKLVSEERLVLQQCDVFFGAQNGCRLKLRAEQNTETGEGTAVLIAYQRKDVDGSKLSTYELTAVPEPKKMEEVLGMSNTVLGKVEKTRRVYIVKRNELLARVHLDEVKDLGKFLEFEVIVNDDSEIEEAHEFAKYLSETFGVQHEDTLAGAYMDMIRENERKAREAARAAAKVPDVITID